MATEVENTPTAELSSEMTEKREEKMEEKRMEEKTETEGKTGEDANLASKVAQHYNGLPETGLDKRGESRIVYMRNFNNWVKSIAISRTLNKLRQVNGEKAELCVLDLCSGKGGDLLKWRKGNISRLVCADIAATSVQQAEERYRDMQQRSTRERHQSKMYSAEFISADCTKVRLADRYKEPKPTFDLTSCQFSFHYSFESYEQADMMLRNASECLKPGGYFIGSTPDAYQLMKRLHDAPGMTFGNDVYRVTFETSSKTDVPLFGARYDFHLEGVVDCPEFLVYFPVLEKMAARHGLRLIQRTPFADFFRTNLTVGEGRSLMGRMQALEMYPPHDGVDLMGKADDDYAKCHEAVEKLQNERQENQEGAHHRGGHKPCRVGTLSQAEWEAVTIYLMFVFQKISEGEIDIEKEGEGKEKEEKEGENKDKEEKEGENKEKEGDDKEKEGESKEEEEERKDEGGESPTSREEKGEMEDEEEGEEEMTKT